jgi:hypothetical protein
LTRLAERCGGWIVFDDDCEETWLPMDAWKSLFESNTDEISE